jgi:hypothetical protein
MSWLITKKLKVEEQMNIRYNITAKLASLKTINTEDFENLENLEVYTAHMVRNILQEWLESSEEIQPKSQTHCRECGNFANYVCKRVGFIQTQFGLLRVRRAYYVCPICHQSTCPLDERLNPVESLARLRAKLAGGKQLPVAETAKDWGFGSIRNSIAHDSFNNPNQFPDTKSLNTNFQCEPVGTNQGTFIQVG